MEYNYIDIEAHVRRARQLRSEAVGELLSAGWHGVKRFCARILHRAAGAAHVNDLVHH